MTDSGLVICALVTTAVAAGLAPSPARADPGDDDPVCRPLFGLFSARPATTCGSPVGFCTTGRVRGGLRADYSFTMNTITSADDPTVPGVFFFTGTSIIDLDHGPTVLGTDTGTVDLGPAGTHRMASLITFIDGASGHLVLGGTLDPVTGQVRGHYEGEICR